MLSRSLNTFMNAMTYSEFTMYPFATQNVQDYLNLLSVYLDAVFFPKLDRTDFLQEGHRLEFETIDDSKTPLGFKGVVYNEMKGAMSDPGALFSERLVRSLYDTPESPYHHNSGGDPEKILDLTYEQLVDFHRRHYHPSNCAFFSYGDLPPPLDAVEQHVLSRFSSVVDDDIDESNATRDIRDHVTHRVPRWTAPRVESVTGPVDPMIVDPNRQHKISLSFLCNQPHDKPLQMFGLNLLSFLLVDGPTSPMYQQLIESELGSDYAPATGFHGQWQESFLSIGLSGVHKDRVDEVSDRIMSTARSVMRKGFEDDRIEAAFHLCELTHKRVGAKYGIKLIEGMVPHFVHGSEVTTPLFVGEMIEQLQARLDAGSPYFQALLDRFVLQNKHRLQLTMAPDEEHAAKLLERERQRLQTVAAEVAKDPQRQQRIINDAQQVAMLAQRGVGANDPNIDMLPTLVVDDIDRQVRRSKFAPVRAMGNTKVYSLESPTNGVGIFHALIKVNDLPQFLRPYLPVFASVATDMGAGEMDYMKLAQRLDLHTGGIKAVVNVFNQYDAMDTYDQSIAFGGSALKHKVSYLLDLCAKIMTQPRIDDVRHLRNLLLQTFQDAGSAVTNASDSFAQMYAASTTSPGAAAREMYSGISSVRFLNSLITGVALGLDDVGDQDEEQVIQWAYLTSLNLVALAEHLFSNGVDRVMVVGDSETLDAFEKPLEGFLDVCQAYENTTVSTIAASVREGMYMHSGVGMDYDVDKNAEISHEEAMELHQKKQKDRETTKDLGGDQLAASMAPMDGNTAALMRAPPPSKRTFIALPVQVHNVAMVVPTVPLSHEDNAKLLVLSRMINSHLHSTVREQGGAYGVFAVQSQDTFNFTSFRDPHVERTIEAFRNVVHSAMPTLRRNFQMCRDEALLDIFGTSDAPQSPSQQGSHLFYRGISDDDRQAYRDRLFAVTLADIEYVADKYLSPEQLHRAHVAVLGDEHDIPQSVTRDEAWQVQDASGNVLTFES
eukprot:TRINITY_DN66383_c13_g1_i1.p1 TRINITY_DN66383_c13_g1~~TRINITY_DN66383_c13_g1_i1.p1  ORF type:complete len:1002 (-),score=613.58 TRINITY_DN66383_c13_g1_i1:82-3087(-)